MLGKNIWPLHCKHIWSPYIKFHLLGFNGNQWNPLQMHFWCELDLLFNIFQVIIHDPENFASGKSGWTPNPPPDFWASPGSMLTGDFRVHLRGLSELRGFTGPKRGHGIKRVVSESPGRIIELGQHPIFSQLCYMSQKASLHFCQECNNLLYPKADAQRRIIVYACRICQYSEIVENQLVYRNDLLTVTKCASVPLQNFPFSNGSRREQVGITTDLGADATLVRFGYLTW